MHVEMKPTTHLKNVNQPHGMRGSVHTLHEGLMGLADQEGQLFISYVLVSASCHVCVPAAQHH